MSVPSHNLYDFIHHITERKFLMFYFYPWGEKDYRYLFEYQKDLSSEIATQGINGLSSIYAKKFIPDHWLDERAIRNFQPVLFCHDQEPLDFEFYHDDAPGMQKCYEEKFSQFPYPISQQNLRSCHVWSWQEKWILLHTEKNSLELERYEKTGQYQGAFWWSHALISRDWYRYAQHDLSLNFSSTNKKLFLIYSRDETGSRKYRKQFLDSLIPINHHCQIGSMDGSQVNSDSSATYNSLDCSQTEISLVLETLFEDPRIYLTEKTLRPLACGHPFILAAGSRSLEFLRSYGFETFHPWIDESYDLETNHDRRREMIVMEMYRIANLGEIEKSNLIHSCRLIAEKNKKMFFSKNFENRIINELQKNVNDAYEKIKDRLSGEFRWNIVKWRKKHGLFKREPMHAITTRLTRYCRVHKGSLEQYQGHQDRLDDKSSTDGHDV